MRVNDKQKNLNVIEEEAQLTDMGLTDEELDGIRGGRLTGAEEDGGGGIGGDWIINHNETTVSDNEVEAQLTDLGLTDEELDGIRGGKLTGSEDGGGGGMGGDWIINHNETILTDTLN